eukprot:Rhum_TRINITY_DN11380_c0_g1::Rhum_TRINITY_DN11380_c0_g1_i1::g.44267::m.44267
MTVDELPESQAEAEPQVQEETTEEAAVVVEQKRTWRPAFDTTFQDMFTYVVALLCGCFCVYVFFYSPAVGYERMLKSKVPKLEFDTPAARMRVAKFAAWWSLTAGLVVFGAASVVIGAIGLVLSLWTHSLTILSNLSGFAGQKSAKSEKEKTA